MKPVRLARDMVTAGLLTFGGVAIAAFAAANYGLGTLRMIGPGAFPIGVGVLMALMGVLIGLADYFKRIDRSEGREIKWEDLLRTSAAVVAFAVLIQPFGAIPAILALTFIAMATRERKTWMQAIVVSIFISAASIALFQYTLGLRFSALKWPL